MLVFPYFIWFGYKIDTQITYFLFVFGFVVNAYNNDFHQRQ